MFVTAAMSLTLLVSFSASADVLNIVWDHFPTRNIHEQLIINPDGTFTTNSATPYSGTWSMQGDTVYLNQTSGLSCSIRKIFYVFSIQGTLLDENLGIYGGSATCGPPNHNPANSPQTGSWTYQ